MALPASPDISEGGMFLKDSDCDIVLRITHGLSSSLSYRLGVKTSFYSFVWHSASSGAQDYLPNLR